MIDKNHVDQLSKLSLTLFRKNFFGIYHGSISTKLDHSTFMINTSDAIFDEMSSSSFCTLNINKQDYRWKIVHGYIKNPLLWGLFNLLFIAFYQQILFVGFTLPLFILSQQSNAVISIPSVIAILFFFTFLTIETIADQQQYTFQQSKYGVLPKRDHYEEDYKKGFRTTGLFSLSRHPNYFGELGVWWSIYLLVATSLGALINWTIIGPIMLTLLFMGSTYVTELITSSKYPEYSEYQKVVWPILPKLRR